MTRTVDPTLAAALLVGAPHPYVIGYIGYSDGSVLGSAPVISYKLTGLTLQMELPYHADLGGDQTHCWLERGLTIAGTNYTVKTGRFYIDSQRYLPNGNQIVFGTVFPKAFYSAAGDTTYTNVITAFCAAFNTSAEFGDAGAYWGYQFYPAGKNVVFSNANSFLALLKQKYLIFSADHRVTATGAQRCLFYSCQDIIGAADFNLTLNADYFLDAHLDLRQFIWKDEIGVLHTSGTATDPLHNLGYLETTASPPARTYSSYRFECVIRPNLAIVDGDIVQVNFLAGFASFKFFSLVTEIYSARTRSKSPVWHTKLSANTIFDNTEGGSFDPSSIPPLTRTIETIKYSPIAAPGIHQFTAADNNIQQALETLDTHQHNQSDVLGTNLFQQTVPAGSTYFTSPFLPNPNATEVRTTWPISGVLKYFYVRLGTAQPGTGNMVVTVRVDGVNTALTVTIPAGSAANTFSDTTHSVNFTAGSKISFGIVNNASSASGGLSSITVGLISIPTT